VSKRWNELFSAAAVCSSSFYSSNSNASLDTTAPEWRKVYLRHAKRRLALTTGRPSSKASYPCGWGSSSHDKNLIFYSHGMLAWCEPQNRRVVHLLCLRSGAVKCFVSANLEAIVCVRVSDRIVAVLTSHGYCQVWNYESAKEGIFRLPDANDGESRGMVKNDFLVDEDTVAICLAGRRSIIVWNLRSQISREIETASPPFHMFLHAQRNQLIAIHFGNEQSRMETIEFDPVSQLVGITYSTDGSYPSGHRSFLLPFPRARMVFFPLFRKVPLVDGPDGVAFSLRRDDEMEDFVAFLSYSKGLNRPILRFYPKSFYAPIRRADHAIIVSSDVLYCVTYRVTSPGISPDVYNPRQHEPTYSEIGVIEGLLSKGTRTYPYNVYHCFGDDLFYGVVSHHHGIQVWCFDEDQHMAGEIGMYRKFNVENMAARAEERKMTLRVQSSHPQ
ncbi:hypothetical protein PRK78_004864, partial [Emydomyces testavorans]